MDDALLLISGGIDSPVAGFLTQKKFDANLPTLKCGASDDLSAEVFTKPSTEKKSTTPTLTPAISFGLLKAIHFSQVPFTDNTPEKKSLAAAKKLGIKELIIVEAGNELQKIANLTYREYYFVLLKIFFMKVSEKIAQKNKINFLITGESLGQVSSQTMNNLDTINSQVKIEIIRPCLFMEKQDIIDISRKEGFFEISKGPEMCDVLASGKPKTQTRTSKVKKEMEKCEMEKLVESALKKIRTTKTKDSEFGENKSLDETTKTTFCKN